VSTAAVVPAAGPPRCGWALGSDVETVYHDTVWGVPQREPVRLFEYLNLEGAQAGLSWRTILRKQPAYQTAFAGFDPVAVAAFGPADVERLLADTGIVRNRAKIEATIGNARAWLELEDPVAFLWAFVGDRPLQPEADSPDGVPARTAVSERMSKELRRRGFRFVGPTICYAFMQACGMVNDHEEHCFRRAEVRSLG
jgi:DNA-3-methyladenine glycosylase I